MASRVTELDASTLDTDFLNVIITNLELYLSDVSDSPVWTTVYKYIKRSVPLLYYVPLVVKGSSPGQQLLGCRFGNFTVRNRLFLYLLEHLAPLVLTAIKEDVHAPQITTSVERILTITACLQLVNYLVFLSSGGSSTFVRRFMGINTEVKNNALQGRLNNANVNRELLGHCLANIFMVMKPFTELVKTYFLRNTLVPRNVTTNNGVVCCHCSDLAVVALEAQKENGETVVFCNYCYYVAKQKQRFISVTTFSLAKN
ncbi:unnamed protein product [Bursaphelenchus xylophilus]|uniref:(pine wood nematode) hypothetical protein n=1 Tax=Bursaphelenchus xylophilus TaxID=6326 RepID=A0A1I7SDP7_BURXY|nr:unnamed protein product [Bursaphelenchus xylophilus]CAG9084459.1 unnamed protein product [Bursaphelenchus xylophilus]